MPFKISEKNLNTYWTGLNLVDDNSINWPADQQYSCCDFTNWDKP